LAQLSQVQTKKEYVSGSNPVREIRRFQYAPQPPPPSFLAVMFLFILFALTARAAVKREGDEKEQPKQSQLYPHAHRAPQNYLGTNQNAPQPPPPSFLAVME